MATDGGTVDIPVVGREKKSTALLVGGAAVAVILYAVIEKRKQAAAAAAATTAAATAGQFTDPAGNVCGAPDPSTGFCPGTAEDTAAQEQLQQYNSSGEPVSSLTGLAGTSTVPVFTNNGAWAQYVEQLLGSSGSDATAAAIAAYLAGQSLSEAQVTVVEEAIAVGNYPPVSGSGGFPPSMNVAAGSTTTPGTCPSGFTWSSASTGAQGETAATGGSGWCEPEGTPATGVTPVTSTTPGTTTVPAPAAGGKPVTVAPSGFRVVSVTNGDDVNLAWDPLTPPAGEGPLTGYMIAYGPTSGSQQYKQQVGGQTTEATVPGVGAGAAGSHYFELWALPASPGGPHAGPVEATTSKS